MRQCPCAVVDLGAGEIEFYTLHYPRSIGKDWPIASALAPELALLRQCKAQRTLFLQASPNVLRARKEADASRERGFFPHSTNILLPMKQQWFHAQPNTDFINTDNLSKEQLCKQVHDWVKQMLMELDNLSLNIKQHRIIPDGGARRKNFCEMLQKAQGILDGLPSIFGKYHGNFWRDAPSEQPRVNDAVLP